MTVGDAALMRAQRSSVAGADGAAAGVLAARWDTLLLEWPRAHLLQSFGSGMVQAQVGWRPRRLEVSVPGRAVLPLLALVGTPGAGLPRRLYVPKGPACAPDDAVAWAATVAAVERLGEVEGAAEIEVEPNAWDEELPLLREHLGTDWSVATATRQPAVTALVSLDGGMDEVLARMRPKGRYNVRLAARRGVVCSEIVDPDEAVAAIGPLLTSTARRQDAHLPDALHVRRVLDAMPTARVLVARVDGEVVAAIVLATFGTRAIYLYGASADRHRERQPSAAIQAFGMERAIDAGCLTYDLWGIPPDADPSHPWRGLRQFKLNLGGVERRTAGALVSVRRPAAARLLHAADAARRAGGRLIQDGRALARSRLSRGRRIRRP